jgi:GT2 family glycosyltransferase
VTFSVVILSALAANLIPCVEALLKREPDLAPERIVVVDDGARAEAEPKLPKLRWVSGVKPFVYARNANLGMNAAGTDVVLLNDDARLVTDHGLTRLTEQAERQSGLGVVSAGILGVVGNPRQLAGRSPRFRLEPEALAFICVFLPQRIYQSIGPLDERFSGYGWEDTDYCLRLRRAGLRLGIWDGCVVDHAGGLPSTFRTRPDLATLFEHNRLLYRAKWIDPAPAVAQSVDLLYLAYNRLEFTRETFSALVANTDWQYVRQLHVYDDGSTDGTRDYLRTAIRQVPTEVRLEETHLRHAVASTLQALGRTSAPILAKTDNDAMLPPGWLRAGLAVLERHPELQLLGIEAMSPHVDDPDVPRSFTPAEFISGLGLYRREAFARSRPVAVNRWFGLEEWQMAQGPGLVRGWMTPALPVFLLDRLPFHPWRALSDEYIRRGWQRPWQGYPHDSPLWHWRWPARGAAEGRLPSLNLGYCEGALEGYTNADTLPIDGVAPLDLRKDWPWQDNSVGHVRAWDIIEHLPDKIHTMNELWRVLAAGGTAEIAVPTTDGPGAFQDPTHVSFWNRRSFLYYEDGNPYRERFVRPYGISARFRVRSERMENTVDGPRLTILLEAVKG